MKRTEAVALLKEMGDRELVQPSMVIIESKSLGEHQLKIKGNYDCRQIEVFLKGRGFSYEESENYLIIFKP